MTKNKVFNAIGLSEIRFIYGSHKPQIVVTRKEFCQGKADKKKCGDLQYVFLTKPRLQPQHLLCYKPSSFFLSNDLHILLTRKTKLNNKKEKEKVINTVTNKDQPMTVHHEDVSWLTNKNTSICQKTFKMSHVLDA